jgi:predicted enzyme related to lactoylglutathione lyase
MEQFNSGVPFHYASKDNPIYMVRTRARSATVYRGMTMPGARFVYVEIPAREPEESAAFYEQVFGWKSRKRGDGTLAFDDAGSVSGAWVTDRPPQEKPGIVTYVMVDDAEAALARIVEAGGRVVVPLGALSESGAAHFADPVGNVLGVYQE